MANKQALRDLQTRLADRLQAARTEPLARSWLAVECASRGFLFPLRESAFMAFTRGHLLENHLLE